MFFFSLRALLFLPPGTKKFTRQRGIPSFLGTETPLSLRFTFSVCGVWFDSHN